MPNRRSDLSYVFALGYSDKTYNGYRVVTTTEVKTAGFIRSFTESYILNKGILCLETISERKYITCESNHLAILANRWLYCGKVQSDQIIRLHATQNDHNDCEKNISTIQVSLDTSSSIIRVCLFTNSDETFS